MIDPQHRWRVTYQRPIEYEILNAPGLFQPENLALLSAGRIENGRRFVVVDSNVFRHFGEALQAYFDYHRIRTKIVTFPSGEENKTVDAYLSILYELDSFPIHRRDEPIIAIGGGVLTDVVGFIASSYRRSVPHIKVPTTLMGYIDASVGIKTGINFNGHKNRLGSFEPPRCVLLDRAFLRTLPRRHILNGVCEIIKLAVIKDPHLFHLLEVSGLASIRAHFQDDPGGEMLDRAISSMLEELEPNLFEENLERKVDFGHTFSYGLETRHEAHLLHGEAVLLDILASTLIAQGRGLLSECEVERIFRLVHRLGIQLNTNLLDAALMWENLQERVEHRNGYQRVPMPNGIGNCIFLNDIRREEIEQAVQHLVQISPYFSIVPA
ncbi:MAG: 2-epi-5-epi-valiolone synthase [Anaerolineae bacterium]|nr:MAG: 2-epi-5-epi-valiolone synthase [Anaerolineae bacterium]